MIYFKTIFQIRVDHGPPQWGKSGAVKKLHKVYAGPPNKTTQPSFSPFRSYMNRGSLLVLNNVLEKVVSFGYKVVQRKSVYKFYAGPPKEHPSLV